MGEKPRDFLVGPIKNLTDITTSTSFQRISGMLKSTDSASCKPTSDCYAESFAQSEPYALSTNLPMLYRDVEIWRKRLLGNYESGCTYT